MELILVRHAVAHDRDARRWPDDLLRPLTPAGIARAQRAAAGLARIAPRPVSVLASPAVRTLETAAILTRTARWPIARPCPQLEPGAATAAVLRLLAQVRRGPIALVGHQPDLGELLAACLPGRASGSGFDFRKLGAACVGFEGPVAAGRGELHWLLPARVLRALRPRSAGR